MFSLPGYHITESVYKSVHTLVYRGIRESDNASLIFKLPVDEHPGERQLVKYQQEFDILNQLDIPGVIHTHGLEYDHARPILLLEDIGGQSLDILMAELEFTIADFFQHAIRTTEILQIVHTAGVIHKDINPSNLVLNPETREINLIDFGISALLPRESVSFQTPGQLQGTLAYISPEQTGRMNRDVDYRSDFYSLGATFYEMLTAQTPFEGDDALSLIHAHLARRAVPPHELNAQVSPALSGIILKLLSKSAEERYQSANGIRSDLIAIQQDGEAFEPGLHDVSDVFCLPQRLYGRESEIAQITASIDRVANGAGELLLVSGSAGIGKTRLINACRQPLTAARGYFCEGKFDQLQQATPYLALKQALNMLVRQLLTESDARLAEWKVRLQNAFGQNGQLMLSFTPDLEKIVGPQPVLAEVLPAQVRSRLQWSLQQTLMVFCRPEHPLVIFLDDWQWADSASLDLLMTITTNTQHLLVIGAYRDSETDKAYLLRQALDKIRHTHSTVKTLTLAPLTPQETEALIRDTLPSPLVHASLARLIHEKTAGNPFFIGVFLNKLHAGQLLSFSAQFNGWSWDETRIRAQHITDNVADLMASRLAQLQDNVCNALKIAACMGNRFVPDVLQKASQDNMVDWPMALRDALASGLITPLEQSSVEYRFVHDRIQQAVHDLLQAEERQQLHWNIGRHLWGTLTEDSEDTQLLFAIANHLNEGLPANLPTSSPDIALQLARLNLRAGQAASSNASYDIALRYFKAGIELLNAESWANHYELRVALHLKAAETAFLQADDEGVKTYTNTLLAQASTPLEKIQAYDILFRASLARFANWRTSSGARLSMSGLAR
ncbi:MAG: AAA family ATPase [Pseudomonadota bacterium]